MKIALIVPGGVDAGGIRIIPSLLSLIRQLTKDHQVHVFATHQEPQSGVWSLEGATIHNLGLPRTSRQALSAILRENKKSRFQIVQSIWAGPCGALAVAAGKLLRIPSIVHVAGGELAAITDIGYGGCLTWRGGLLQNVVLKLATQVTAASTMICDLIAKYNVTAQRLPLGVDFQQWPLEKPKPRNQKDQFRLIHIASLNLVKDQQTLIDAIHHLAKRNYDFVLDIAGEDTLDGKIQALCGRLGLNQHVRFHGYLSHERLRPIVEAAHVAVMSSRHEAGPIALLEAAAVGVPTVGTAVGHIKEWHPNATIAVPCQEPILLANAVEKTLIDEDFRKTLADAAFTRVAKMSATQTAESFCKLYDHLTRTK